MTRQSRTPAVPEQAELIFEESRRFLNAIGIDGRCCKFERKSNAFELAADFAHKWSIRVIQFTAVSQRGDTLHEKLNCREPQGIICRKMQLLWRIFQWWQP